MYRFPRFAKNLLNFKAGIVVFKLHTGRTFSICRTELEAPEKSSPFISQFNIIVIRMALQDAEYAPNNQISGSW